MSTRRGTPLRVTLLTRILFVSWACILLADRVRSDQITPDGTGPGPVPAVHDPGSDPDFGYHFFNVVVRLHILASAGYLALFILLFATVIRLFPVSPRIPVYLPPRYQAKGPTPDPTRPPPPPRWASSAEVVPGSFNSLPVAPAPSSPPAPSRARSFLNRTSSLVSLSDWLAGPSTPGTLIHTVSARTAAPSPTTIPTAPLHARPGLVPRLSSTALLRPRPVLDASTYWSALVPRLSCTLALTLVAMEVILLFATIWLANYLDALTHFRLLPLATALAQGPVSHPAWLPVYSWHDMMDATLLTTLWYYQTYLTQLALWLVLPFAYFFTETDPTAHFLGRAREALFTTVLVQVLQGISVAVVTLGFLDLPSTLAESWLYYTWLCALGLPLSLVLLPHGLTAFWAMVRSLPLPFDHRRRLQLKIDIIVCQIQSVERELDRLHWQRRRSLLDHRAAAAAVEKTDGVRPPAVTPARPSRRRHRTPPVPNLGAAVPRVGYTVLTRLRAATSQWHRRLPPLPPLTRDRLVDGGRAVVQQSRMYLFGKDQSSRGQTSPSRPFAFPWRRSLTTPAATSGEISRRPLATTPKLNPKRVTVATSVNQSVTVGPEPDAVTLLRKRKSKPSLRQEGPAKVGRGASLATSSPLMRLDEEYLVVAREPNSATLAQLASPIDRSAGLDVRTMLVRRTSTPAPRLADAPPVPTSPILTPADSRDGLTVAAQQLTSAGRVMHQTSTQLERRRQDLLLLDLGHDATYRRRNAELRRLYADYRFLRDLTQRSPWQWNLLFAGVSLLAVIASLGLLVNGAASLFWGVIDGDRDLAIWVHYGLPRDQRSTHREGMPVAFDVHDYAQAINAANRTAELAYATQATAVVLPSAPPAPAIATERSPWYKPLLSLWRPPASADGSTGRWPPGRVVSPPSEPITPDNPCPPHLPFPFPRSYHCTATDLGADVAIPCGAPFPLGFLPGTAPFIDTTPSVGDYYTTALNFPEGVLAAPAPALAPGALLVALGLSQVLLTGFLLVLLVLGLLSLARAFHQIPDDATGTDDHHEPGGDHIARLRPIRSLRSVYFHFPNLRSVPLRTLIVYLFGLLGLIHVFPTLARILGVLSPAVWAMATRPLTRPLRQVLETSETWQSLCATLAWFIEQAGHWYHQLDGRPGQGFYVAYLALGDAIRGLGATVRARVESVRRHPDLTVVRGHLGRAVRFIMRQLRRTVTVSRRWYNAEPPAGNSTRSIWTLIYRLGALWLGVAPLSRPLSVDPYTTHLDAPAPSTLATPKVCPAVTEICPWQWPYQSTTQLAGALPDNVKPPPPSLSAATPLSDASAFLKLTKSDLSTSEVNSPHIGRSPAFTWYPQTPAVAITPAEADDEEEEEEDPDLASPPLVLRDLADLLDRPYHSNSASWAVWWHWQLNRWASQRRQQGQPDPPGVLSQKWTTEVARVRAWTVHLYSAARSLWPDHAYYTSQRLLATCPRPDRLICLADFAASGDRGAWYAYCSVCPGDPSCGDRGQRVLTGLHLLWNQAVKWSTDWTCRRIPAAWHVGWQVLRAWYMRMAETAGAWQPPPAAVVLVPTRTDTVSLPAYDLFLAGRVLLTTGATQLADHLRRATSATAGTFRAYWNRLSTPTVVPTPHPVPSEVKAALGTAQARLAALPPAPPLPVPAAYYQLTYGTPVPSDTRTTRLYIYYYHLAYYQAYFVRAMTTAAAALTNPRVTALPSDAEWKNLLQDPAFSWRTRRSVWLFWWLWWNSFLEVHQRRPLESPSVPIQADGFSFETTRPAETKVLRPLAAVALNVVWAALAVSSGSAPSMRYSIWSVYTNEPAYPKHLHDPLYNTYAAHWTSPNTDPNATRWLQAWESWQAEHWTAAVPTAWTSGRAEEDIPAPMVAPPSLADSWLASPPPAPRLPATLTEAEMAQRLPVPTLLQVALFLFRAALTLLLSFRLVETFVHVFMT
ncbi:hypothetical protein IWQ60_003420 [Tieghemiomyces parasiticus]|uniref:Uncharacterized protein n=1 Tax=Tieghemiomyces parasiticus TaxID=78921 RepID=A0A9W8E083_9FUNG|nr:hypothetical protein IWQ60_003420 [Tieghemiomyces parasiticus]